MDKRNQIRMFSEVIKDINSYTLNDNIRRTQNKGAIVFLQEIGVAHQRKWQQIRRTGRSNIISVYTTGVVHVLLHVKVTSDIVLDSISVLGH